MVSPEESHVTRLFGRRDCQLFEVFSSLSEYGELSREVSDLAVLD